MCLFVCTRARRSQRHQASGAGEGEGISQVHVGELVMKHRVAQTPVVEARHFHRFAIAVVAGVAVLEEDAEAAFDQVGDRKLVELEEAVEWERGRTGVERAGIGQGLGQQGWTTVRLGRVQQGSGALAIVVRKAEQAWVRVGAEVAGREGLHRVSNPYPLADAREGIGTGRWRLDRGDELVEQVADHHGRGKIGVVLNALPNVRKMDALPCGKDGLEEQVAVVGSARAVAGFGVVGDVVEAHRPAAPRKRSVRETQHADHAERDGPHRQHRAERHPLGQKTTRRSVGLQPRFDQL